MRITFLFLSTRLFFIPFTTAAQNLVPDPGFELVKNMPAGKSNSINCTKNWTPVNGAGDYYNTGASRHAGVPRNIFGKQEPHSGNGYGGICIRKDFMEYLVTKLSDTLRKDQEYLVEFYISRAERSLGYVNEFGIIFTKKPVWVIDNRRIFKKPALDFTSTSGYKSKKKWIRLSAVYKAQGDEAVLVLGYFNYDHPDGKRVNCHYYIDDVSVTPIGKQADPITPVKTEDPAPDAFSPAPGKPIVLQNIFFATGKSELLPGSSAELDKLAQYLVDTPDASITITGHTDNTGNEDQNKILSAARAKAVADYLVSKEIDESRIHYIGSGSSVPIAGNDTEEGKQQNRRVEFMITRN